MNNKICENCVYCVMYDECCTLCSFFENWVESNTAIYCEQYIRDGGSDE